MPNSHSDEKPAAAPPKTEMETGTGPEPGFDQILDRLRQVVQKLEQGNLPLEQALKSFEEGVRLSRRGSAILDAAEQRVELLLRDENGGEERQPLPGTGPQSEARSSS